MCVSVLSIWFPGIQLPILEATQYWFCDSQNPVFVKERRGGGLQGIRGNISRL